MSYLFLLLTILCEAGAIICMKLGNGFKHVPYAAASIILYIGSFVFMTLAVRTLGVGIANAIWAGASTLLVYVAGTMVFGDKISTMQFAFLLLIVIGLVGLQYTKPA
ncbi:MAG: hypothetical protein RL660_1792 [Bacteroidota bacterium]|jgi:multidrug transporter EmrE-like cation transporter